MYYSGMHYRRLQPADAEVFQKLRVSKDKVIKKKDQPKAAGEATPVPPAGIPGVPSIPVVSPGK